MSFEADDAQARREVPRGRNEAESGARSRRLLATFQLAMAPLWVLFAASRWLDDDADALSRWMFTSVAVAYVISAVLVWPRVLRRLPDRGREEPRID